MARVSTFSREIIGRISLHEEVDAQLFTYDLDGRKLMQINTVGRPTRELPGKVSQSLQFDEASARELFEAFRDHFGFK